MVKLNPQFNDSTVQYFSITLFAIFLLLCIMPIHCFYLRARKQVAKSLWETLISPFGRVKFRDFFLADIITSMTGPIQHMFIIACYYKEGHFKTGLPVKIQDECQVANGFFWVFAFLPYWWRFAQCLNKYKNTKMKVHLINGGKYFSCLVSPAVLMFLVKSDSRTGLKFKDNNMFWLYFVCKFVQTTYCFIWDIYMDWGLLRQNKPGSNNRFLREKMNFPPVFYYWAIFSDFILRYIYLVFLFNYGNPDSFFNSL